MEKKIVVNINTGLEPRAAALFVQIASKFKSSVYIIIENTKVNAKSIMGMMSVAIEKGQEIVISANGEDEKQAIDELSNYLTNDM